MRNLSSWIGLVMLAVFIVGCGLPETTKPEKDGGHGDHPSEGPHHGALIEWGEEEYHPEFTVDHEKKEARVYILGPDAKTAKPIKAETITLSIKDPLTQIELKAEKQATDPEGTASVFVGTHDNLSKEQEFEGSIKGEVDGKTYEGDFKEEPHEDHDDE